LHRRPIIDKKIKNRCGIEHRLGGRDNNKTSPKHKDNCRYRIKQEERHNIRIIKLPLNAARKSVTTTLLCYLSITTTSSRESEAGNLQATLHRQHRKQFGAHSSVIELTRTPTDAFSTNVYRIQAQTGTNQGKLISKTDSETGLKTVRQAQQPRETWQLVNPSCNHIKHNKGSDNIAESHYCEDGICSETTAATNER
jgi:hypothetical protein